MITYKFLSIDQITCFSSKSIPRSVAEQFLTNHKTLTVEEYNGTYFLIDGIDFYHALRVLSKNKLVACEIISPNSARFKRLVKLLVDQVNNDSIYLENKKQIIDHLVIDLAVEPHYIANHVDKNVDYILDLMFEPNGLNNSRYVSLHDNIIEAIQLHPFIPSKEKDKLIKLARAGELSFFQLYLICYAYHSSTGLYSYPYYQY